MFANRGRTTGIRVTLVLMGLAGTLAAAGAPQSGPVADRLNSPDPHTVKLAREVREKGWIVFGSRTRSGDWDLFSMRPTGRTSGT